MDEQLEFFRPEHKESVRLPLVTASVQAGFPSPAEDHIEQTLDLNELLITHPAATFFVRVQGNSMAGANIKSGDILIVNRALTPKDGQIIIAAVSGEFTVKRIRIKGKEIFLHPENPRFSPIQITDPDTFQVWGVVTYIIHKVGSGVAVAS